MKAANHDNRLALGEAIAALRRIEFVQPRITFKSDVPRDDELTIGRYALREVGTNNYLIENKDHRGKTTLSLEEVGPFAWPKTYVTEKAAVIAVALWKKHSPNQRLETQFETVVVALTVPLADKTGAPNS